MSEELRRQMIENANYEDHHFLWLLEDCLYVVIQPNGDWEFFTRTFSGIKFTTLLKATNRFGYGKIVNGLIMIRVFS